MMRAPILSVFCLAASLAGCRGQPNEEPPLHVIGDMDWQPRYDPQSESEFFADKRTSRPLVDGTVPQGVLREDDALYRGRNADGSYVEVAPVQMSRELVLRGQERFNIYCSPCHDQSGAGRGTVVQRGYPPPVDLTSERVRDMPDGEIFHVITNGARNMPAYRKQVQSENDRWAIVAWVRTLQRSQYATIEDVPREKRDQIEQGSGK